MDGISNWIETEERETAGYIRLSRILPPFQQKNPYSTINIHSAVLYSCPVQSVLQR